MKKVLVLFLALAASTTMFGAACGVGSLAAYIGLGAGGCEVGPVNFSSFSYSAGTNNGVGSAADVTVTPGLSGVFFSVGYGLTFSAAWTNASGTDEADILYTATALPSFLLDAVRLTIFANAVAGNATTEKFLDFAGAPPSLTASLTNGVGGTFSEAPMAPNTASVGVTDALVLTAVTGAVFQDSASNHFSVVDIGGPDIPEPASMMLLGGGLLGLALMARKVRK